MCVVCEQQFYAVMAKSKYCSPACSAVAYRTRMKERAKSEPVLIPAPMEPKERKPAEPVVKVKSKVVLEAERQLKAKQDEDDKKINAQLKEADEILTKTKQ